MSDVVWMLVAAAFAAFHVAELFLLRKLETEFSANSGHSLRDLADRMEMSLRTAEATAERVAEDLAGAIGRADAVDGSPGEASDAASRSPQED
jgi:hypothetical protein